MQKPPNTNLEKALYLVIDSDVNLSDMFKQDGVLKQLTR